MDKESRFEQLLRHRAGMARDLASWMVEWRAEWRRQGLPGDGFGVLRTLDEQALQTVRLDDYNSAAPPPRDGVKSGRAEARP